MSHHHITQRYYEKQYPEPDEPVMVEVNSIHEMGVYVRLLEYGNIEGMIVSSELSKRRIRSMAQIVRVGRQEVVVVLRVDQEKGYIDLSKRKVTANDLKICTERYNKSKLVHTIMQNVAETQHKDLEELYRTIVWPLAQRFKHAHKAFEEAIANPDVFKNLTIDPPVLEYLMQVIRRRLAPQPVRIRADVEITCFAYAGVSAIKEALLQAESASDEHTKVEAKVTAVPRYMLTSTVVEKISGLATLAKAVHLAKTSIEAAHGRLVVLAEPFVVSEKEEDKGSDEDEGEEQEEDEGEEGEEQEEGEGEAPEGEASGEGSRPGRGAPKEEAGKEEIEDV